MSEFKFRDRFIGVGLIASLAAPAIGSCSSAANVPKPSTLPSCLATQPKTWEPIALNINTTRVAERLDVDATKLAQFGLVGMAVCKKALSVDDIHSTAPPIIEVSGIGSPCLVIGTPDEHRPGTQTAEILAVCYTNGSSA